MKRIVYMSCALALYALAPFLYQAGVTGTAVMAAEEEKARETRRVPAMSEATYKKLSEAQEAVEAKDYAKALDVLNNMLAHTRTLNGNEIGQIYNILGFVYFSQEPPAYGKAIDAYKQVLAQGENIPSGLEVQTIYTLAQLSFVNDNYQQALDYMRQWITKAENPGPDPYVFLGQVYYQMNDYPSAITQLEKAVAISKARNTAVKEQTWALLNYLYYEQENWPKVLETLETLVRDYPKRDYWVRLAGIHAQLGHDKESLWSYDAAYVGGYLTEQGDLLNYAGTLLQANVPWRAARVLEKGLKDGVIKKTAENLQQLGQAWQLAQETAKAIPVLENAAKLSDRGRIYERLAALYLDSDESNKCVTAADSALKKGGLRQEQYVYQVKGMCLSNLKQPNKAREAFVTCRTIARREKDETNRRNCQQWIQYLENEQKREEQIQRASS